MDLNEDLTREWKVISKQPPDHCILHKEEYRQQLVEHKKRLDDQKRVMAKQSFQDSRKTTEQRFNELYSAIKDCEYEQFPAEPQQMCID